MAASFLSVTVPAAIGPQYPLQILFPQNTMPLFVLPALPSRVHSWRISPLVQEAVFPVLYFLCRIALLQWHRWYCKKSKYTDQSSGSWFHYFASFGKSLCNVIHICNFTYLKLLCKSIIIQTCSAGFDGNALCFQTLNVFQGI